MTQHQIKPSQPLPACKAGHVARLIIDKRCASAGGGYLIECACAHTGKCVDEDAALVQWRRLHNLRAPRVKKPASNVVQFGLFQGGARR